MKRRNRKKSNKGVSKVNKKNTVELRNAIKIAGENGDTSSKYVLAMMKRLECIDNE